MSNTPSKAEIEALLKRHGATSYRNRADTQHPAYGFTEDGLNGLIDEVLAKWGTPQPVVQEPLPRFTALRFRARRDKKAEVTLLFQGHETADAWVRGITQKGGINADTRAN